MDDVAVAIERARNPVIETASRPVLESIEKWTRNGEPLKEVGPWGPVIETDYAEPALPAVRPEPQSQARDTRPAALMSKPAASEPSIEEVAALIQAAVASTAPRPKFPTAAKVYVSIVGGAIGLLALLMLMAGTLKTTFDMAVLPGFIAGLCFIAALPILVPRSTRNFAKLVLIVSAILVASAIIASAIIGPPPKAAATAATTTGTTTPKSATSTQFMK
ncbi:hypothetical protein [Bosea sp. LC85]|uniref:hypothetical protein n=1 Tax=Bosea sp. LC85 TaxID=1502851 RepID=UPI00126A554E|nr:hypothetical protein [Bosea sp. LC85]